MNTNSKQIKWATVQRFGMVLLTMLTLAACGGGGGAQEEFKEAVAVNELGVIAIEVQSSNTVIETGMQENFRALGTVEDDPGNPIDVTNRVTWSTSNSSVAAINSAGILTGNSAGLVAVRAEWADLSDVRDLEVSDADLLAITITDIPTIISECGAGYQLAAEGSYNDGSTRVITDSVTWSTSDLTIATISEDGVLASLQAGAIELRAQRDALSGASVLGTSSQTIADNLNDITVTPSPATINVGSEQSFTATASYTGDSNRVITDTVTWSSDNSAIVTVSNEVGAKGFAEGVSEGSAIIKATCDPADDFANDEVSVTVNAVATITDIRINAGEARVTADLADGDVQLQAFFLRSDGSAGTEITDNDDLTWTVLRTISGTPAEVSNSATNKGLVTFTGVGETEIEARYDSDDDLFTATIEVKVE